MSLKEQKPDRPTSGDPIPNEDLQNQIRTTAYLLYEARGSGDGHDLDDWLEAEQQVLGSQAKAA